MKTFECFLRVKALTISTYIFLFVGSEKCSRLEAVVRIRFLFTFCSHQFYASHTCGIFQVCGIGGVRQEKQGTEMVAEKNPNKSLIRWIVARVALKKRKWKSEWKNETKRHFHIIAQFICTRNGSQLSIMNPHHHFEYIQPLYVLCS